MTTFHSHNPATGEVLKSYRTLEKDEIAAKVEIAHQAFQSWSRTTFQERRELLMKLASRLREQKLELAKIAAIEMGRTLVSIVAEVEKCSLTCEYYANNAEAFLADEVVKTEASSSYVKYQPLGVIFAIMPWNFPYWQVFRAAAPALMAGNTMVLKHASLVPGCAQAIQDVFDHIGAPHGVFQNAYIAAADSEMIIAHPSVRAITLTGSEGAGSQVAALAGKYLKKCVLELGGSDPFIILDDADVKKAAAVAATARLIANGQSCIAAKRFIVTKKVAAEFTNQFKSALNAIVVGDPLHEATQLGPLASEQIVQTLEGQVLRSVAAGAQVITGGKRLDQAGFFFAPTILTNVKPGMAVYAEETFGPVAAIIEVTDKEEALHVANDTQYGLGSSVWTNNKTTAQYFIDHLVTGCVFVNAMVKSDPRLPFGGTKLSGYGRELSSFGLREFTNVKTVWVE